MVLVLEIITALSILIASITIFTKNIRYVRLCCFECFQKPKQNNDDIQENIEIALEAMKKVQERTPRSTTMSR